MSPRLRVSMLLPLIALPLASSAATAQTDLDFEQGENISVREVLPEQISQTWLSDGWLKWEPEAGDNYEISLDSETFMTGTGSGHIRQTRYSDSVYGTLMQVFPADEYRGKRLQLLGWVKTDTVRGEAYLWMRVDGPKGEMLAFDNMPGRRVMSTSDWTMNFIVLDVPDDAAGIFFGMILDGDGDAWVDCLSFKVVGEDVPTTDIR